MAAGPATASTPVVRSTSLELAAKAVLCGLACLVAAAGWVWIEACSGTPGQAHAVLNSEALALRGLLVATHLAPFALLPAAMHTHWSRAPALRRAGARDPFLAVLGLAFIMVAIAGEMGWHTTQGWVYAEGYSVLNCFFYFALSWGTALWAVGMGSEGASGSVPTDLGLLAVPWLVGAAYLLAATITHTKLPIFLLLTLQYCVLTSRLFKLLRTPHVLWLLFFSVGVNLFFIALLKGHLSHPMLNPLFHVLHDAAGTEAGLAAITALIYWRLPPGEGKELAAED